jgi:hypothetical protein
MSRVLVGTATGLHRVGGDDRPDLEGRAVTAIDGDGDQWLVLVDGYELHRGPLGRLRPIATLEGEPGRCLAASGGGHLVGTAGAHLVRILGGDRLTPVDSFEDPALREGWHTPWGGPPDVRSLAASRDGALHVNVHVGGILRSDDAGESWRPTIDLHADVHQVCALQDGTVVAATAFGLAISTDAGTTWRFQTDGLHARYQRAVAVCGDALIASASDGPRTRNAAVYRTDLRAMRPFERCDRGLPQTFTDNVDTYCIDALGTTAAIGTADGEVYVTGDCGLTWELCARGLGAVRCVAVAAE